MVEALADLPGQAQLTRVVLPVTARKIEADRIAPYMLKRDRHVDFATAPTDRGDQFNLVLKIGGVGRIGYNGAVIDDGIARLLKEERRIAFVGFLHFPDMRNVVAADAIDTPNREQPAANHRQYGRLYSWYNKPVSRCHDDPELKFGNKFWRVALMVRTFRFFLLIMACCCPCRRASPTLSCALL